MKEKETNKEEIFNKQLEETIDNKLEELKHRMYFKMGELIEDAKTAEGFKTIIDESIEESFVIGKAATVSSTEGKKVFGQISDFFTGLKDKDKYRQLYHNQRFITTNLLSTLQIMQSQIISQDENSPENALVSLASAFGRNPVKE